MTVGSPELANLFRATSLDKRKQRFLGEVVLAGPASTPFAVAIAGVCLATLITLAFVIQVPARLHAPGVLLPVGGLATVGGGSKRRRWTGAGRGRDDRFRGSAAHHLDGGSET